MSAAAVQNSGVQCAIGAGSQQPWVPANESFEMKILSVDAERHSAEFLIRVKGGYRSGPHRHTCETHAFLLEGRLKNHTTGQEFGPGDYCYQPHNDLHDEEFLEDSVLYGSWRGDTDKFIEFYDESGDVCGAFTVADVLEMMPK